jgi:hypothetical protein
MDDERAQLLRLPRQVGPDIGLANRPRIVDRPSRGDLLPFRAFRNDDEGRLPVPAARGVPLNASTARVPVGIAMCSVLVRPCVASIVSASP